MKFFCDRCDGFGWYEGGKKYLQTKCEQCNGTGYATPAEEKKPKKRIPNVDRLNQNSLIDLQWQLFHEIQVQDEQGFFQWIATNCGSDREAWGYESTCLFIMAGFFESMTEEDD